MASKTSLQRKDGLKLLSRNRTASGVKTLFTAFFKNKSKGRKNERRTSLFVVYSLPLCVRCCLWSSSLFPFSYLSPLCFLFYSFLLFFLLFYVVSDFFPLFFCSIESPVICHCVNTIFSFFFSFFCTLYSIMVVGFVTNLFFYFSSSFAFPSIYFCFLTCSSHLSMHLSNTEAFRFWCLMTR